MNGFEKYGLKHTSPSQINMFADCAAAWAARYVYNCSGSFGVAAQVGVLVEKVVYQTLIGRDFDEACQEACSKFAKDNALNPNEKQRDRIHDIVPMARQAVDELKPYGVPEHDPITHKQRKIELLCKGEGWEIPVIGYLDFVFPEHGLVVDLKTTLRAPSAMSSAHLRQGAVYKKAMGNHAVKFLYVTPKKYVWHEVENEDSILGGIKNILTRQEKLLRNMDKHQLKDSVPVNAASFYWNGMEGVRSDLYGV